MVAFGLQAACMLVLNLADVTIQLDKIMDVKAFFKLREYTNVQFRKTLLVQHLLPGAKPKKHNSLLAAS